MKNRNYLTTPRASLMEAFIRIAVVLFQFALAGAVLHQAAGALERAPPLLWASRPGEEGPAWL